MKINLKPEQKVITETLRKTQKEWVEYFNNKKQKMVSLPDIYKSVNDKKLIKSLRQDFEDHWLVTSTRIVYNKDNLKAEIIHDADSKVVKPKKYKNIQIPDYDGEFEEDKIAEKYLQALCDTKHNLKTIIKTLKKISGKKTIYLWTPTQSGRKDKQIRSVGLLFDGFDRFDVDAIDWFDYYDGFSRGVLSDSEPKARSKKRKPKCK